MNLVAVLITCLVKAFSSVALYSATYFDIAGGNPPAESIWKIPWKGKVKPYKP